MKHLFHRAQIFYKRYEQYLTAGALLLGFIIDNLTLTRIDLLLDNLILLSYLLLAAVSIALFNIIRSGRAQIKLLHRVLPIFPLLTQFAFGGLFSGYFIFYSSSASSLGSWVFVLALAALLIGNERFQKQYRRFRFQIGIFFVALFSFSIFSLPVAFKTVGPLMFVLSGVVSLAIVSLFVFLLSKVIPKKVQGARRGIAVIVLAIFLVFNGLYFAGAIPPLPLSLKDIGVYHSVNRLADGSYVGIYESPPFYLFYKDNDSTFHRVAGESVTVFSSVFAPTDLEVGIWHEWQYFDEERQRWVTTDTFSFPIVGGRDGGYRGYSTKTSVFEGRWRVRVVTEHSQQIGTVRFSVEVVGNPPRTEERLL